MSKIRVDRVLSKYELETFADTPIIGKGATVSSGQIFEASGINIGVVTALSFSGPVSNIGPLPVANPGFVIGQIIINTGV